MPKACGKLNDGESCVLPKGHDEPDGTGQACCPSKDCGACSGEACWKCGAGLHSRHGEAPCEHDVIDRHEPMR